MYDKIEARYGIAIPDEYRRMHKKGWVDVEDDDNYVGLMEVEWMSLEDILEHQFADYHLPGFAPFAQTGMGDLWCWWPEGTHEGGIPVVLCPHDENMAQIEAPNFLAFCYRRILTYANGGFDADEEDDAREEIEQWKGTFAKMMPKGWASTVASLAKKPLVTWKQTRFEEAGFLTPEECDAIVKRDIPYTRLDEQFKWMKD